MCSYLFKGDLALYSAKFLLFSKIFSRNDQPTNQTKRPTNQTTRRIDVEIHFFREFGALWRQILQLIRIFSKNDQPTKPNRPTSQTNQPENYLWSTTKFSPKFTKDEKLSPTQKQYWTKNNIFHKLHFFTKGEFGEKRQIFLLTKTFPGITKPTNQTRK